MRHCGLYVSAFLCFAASSSLAAAAEAMDEDGTFSFILENDLFADQDRNYTNGVRFAWLSPEWESPRWLDQTAGLALPWSETGRKRFSVAFGQSMFTPENVALNPPSPQQRPYAGWLYGSFGVVSDTGKTLDNLILTVGIVGPHAYAEQAHTFVHRVRGIEKAQGWKHQLKDEPGIMLTYERKWRKMYEFSPFGIGMDLTPHAGFNLGNVFTDATLGATLRLGYDLPADYGPPRIRPSLPGSDFFLPTRTLGGYLFAGVEGRGVARNIFLDGNTFRDGPDVSKKPFIASLQVGAALTYESIRLSYTHVFLTREYKLQRESDQFGAVSLSYRF